MHKQDLLWIWRAGNLVSVSVDQHVQHGTLIGASEPWPTAMEPGYVEWFAPVVFLTEDPIEVFFVCDIVHGHLARFALLALHSNKLDLRQTIPVDIAMAKLNKRAAELRKRVSKIGLRPIVVDILGVALSLSESRKTHTEFFYGLGDRKIPPLIRAARGFDSRIQT